MKNTVKLITILWIILFCQASFALTPPLSPDDLRRYQMDGTYNDRLQFAERLGNHKTHPRLILNLQQRLYALNHLPLPEGFPAPPLDWQGGLPASGAPKALAILVDFPDYPHSASQTVADVQSGLFGAGNVANTPYESLRTFYQRSSYGKLNITGTALGWYRAAHNRSYYSGLGNNIGNRSLIKEAFDYFNAEGHDFSQYDNDGNGVIDAFFIKWTGPDTGWSSFWWAYQTSFNDDSYTVDGKRLGSYVWSWYDNASQGDPLPYSPKTDIHETGHLLGLPDYYDYDNSVGPNGDVGGLDTMDAVWGDHNSFSKFMLEWITPTVVASGSQTQILNPSGASADAVLIMPNATSSTPFAEFFMAQYRKRGIGNDPNDYPTDGLVIWHVDARLNASGRDFLYDNSYTSHKLLRLMEADGLEEIETGDGRADAGDFYLSPKTFGPSTTPNSRNYAGQSTGVTVDNLTTPGTTMSARFAISDSGGGTEIFPPNGAWPTGWTAPTTSNANWTVNGSDPAYEGAYSLRSGAITDNQKSQVQVSGNFQAGTVSFALRVSSEADYDFLKFYIDGVLQGQGSGAIAWSLANYPVTAGTHTLLWSYEKDEAVSSGSDAAWIDNVSLPVASVVTHALTVAKAGTGSGTVTSNPTGISCGADCSENYPADIAVALAATAATGSTFTGWSGACVGAGSCQVTMSAAKSVTATFNAAPTYALTVTKAGSGSGTVTGTGINCGSDCAESYASGTNVTLTATATTGSTFTGWSGACTGTGSCSVTMSAAKTVTATFTTTPASYALTVTKTGSGSGTVTGTGINCGSDCTESYASGTSVTLTATATTGSTFTGWSGACVGAGTCQVTMSAAKTVTATFNLTTPTTYPLTVTKAGTGSGVVSSSPAGINCGATCNGNFSGNVTLTATPANGSTFGGWSGACTGTDSCSVTMTAAKSVTATFTAQGGNEVFPPNGAWPSGWTTPATANAAWIVTNSDPAQEGAYSLRSGAISHSQKSQVEISGNFQAGAITFARRVSSESGYDFLRFFIDGVQQDQWSGEHAWSVVSYALPAGAHTLRWAYEKDVSVSGGSDAAWVDSVSLPPYTDGPITAGDFVVLQPSSPALIDAGAGDDIYLLTPYLLKGGEVFTIADKQGNNRLQLAGGLQIASSEVTATTLRLTLSNGAQLTVNGANTFSYQVGGTTAVGQNPPVVTFANFALDTLGVAVPATGTVVGGPVTLPNTCL